MSSGSVTLPTTGGGSGGVTSINGDTTAAQVIAGGAGISVVTAAGTTTITNTGASGTVTSVSVVHANGINGSVATPTTTPAITLSLDVGAVTDTLSSLATKPSLAVVATTNQALTGVPANIDGITTLIDGSMILLSAQTAGAENGPWVIHAGAWTRPTWFPSGGTTQAFQFITALIRLGTVYQGSVWRMTTSGAVTIDTTAQAWVVTPVAISSSTLAGVLPVANGGTNSLTALNNNRVMQSSGGAIVEAAAITASRALASDSNGIPVAATTTTTELNFVSGVTSAIQTQLNTKLATATFTAVSSNITLAGNTYYFVDTSSARSLALPTPTNGTVIYVKDVIGSAATNNITITRFGSEKIEGLAASYVMTTSWGSITLVANGTDWFLF